MRITDVIRAAFALAAVANAGKIGGFSDKSNVQSLGIGTVGVAGTEQLSLQELIRAGFILPPPHTGPVRADPEYIQAKHKEMEKWKEEAMAVVRSSQLNIEAAKEILGSQEGKDAKYILQQLANARFNSFISNPEDKEILTKGLREFIRLNVESLDVNEPIAGLKGASLLHIAVILGDKELTQTLISRGANLNSLDENGFSPIKVAVLEDNLEIAKILAFSGANTQDLENFNTKDVIRRRYKVNDTLGDKIEKNQQMIRAYGKVYDAVINNNPLPEERALPDISAHASKQVDHYDPIRAINENENDKLLTIVAKNREVLKTKDQLGRSLLDLAALNENSDAVRILLDAGIEPKLMFDKPEQAVRAAAYLKNKADLDKPAKFKETYEIIVSSVKETRESSINYSEIAKEFAEFREKRSSDAREQAIEAVGKVPKTINLADISRVKRGGVRGGPVVSR